MLAHEPVPVDQHDARSAAHLVPLHGVRNGARRIRLIERDWKLQAIFLNEGLDYRRIERVVMFEGGMQAYDGHVLRLEGLEDSLRLGNSDADRVRAQGL